MRRESGELINFGEAETLKFNWYIPNEASGAIFDGIVKETVTPEAIIDALNFFEFWDGLDIQEQRKFWGCIFLPRTLELDILYRLVLREAQTLFEAGKFNEEQASRYLVICALA